MDDQLFLIVSNHGLSWDEALALSEEKRAWLAEQEPGVEIPDDFPDQEASPDQETEEEPDEEVPEEEPVDTYAGPDETDVVGDSRRLRIVEVDPHTGRDVGVVGEAWQGDGEGASEKGRIYGTGIAAVLLYEPSANVRYQNSSIATDRSPLTILYARIARSSFFRGEFVEMGDGRR